MTPFWSGDGAHFTTESCRGVSMRVAMASMLPGSAKRGRMTTVRDSTAAVLESAAPGSSSPRSVRAWVTRVLCPMTVIFPAAERGMTCGRVLGGRLVKS
jgi:hypothetical protein